MNKSLALSAAILFVFFALPVFAQEHEIRDLGVKNWPCLNRLEGTAKTQDGIERNPMKNRSVVDLSSVSVEALDTAGFLKKVSSYDAELKAQRRNQLTTAQKTTLHGYENQIVSLTGYLVSTYPGPPETCNCGDKTFHDFHLEIFEKQSDHHPQIGDPTPIICEITPRTEQILFRDGVRLQTLAGFYRNQKQYFSTNHQSRLIKVTGWLMWDDDHNGQADVGTTVQYITPGNGFHHPWRSTAWEIHPILKVEAVGDFHRSPIQSQSSQQIATPTPAQTPSTTSTKLTTLEAQQKAAQLYPDLLDSSAALSKLRWSRYFLYKRTNPHYFDDPEWPLTLAKECAETLRIAPKK